MADPVLQFFESLGRAFKPKVELAHDVEWGLAALVALLLLLFFLRPLRRRLARGRRFRELARQRGISPAERRRAREMAREAGTDALALAERRSEFERATARALQEHSAGDTSPLVHRLRQALSFDRLPGSAPLLSSRELLPGALLQLGELPARVTAVTEEVLAVALQGEPGLEPGSRASATLTRGRDARYRLRCLVRSAERSAPDGWILQLEHDEAPERLQGRDGVRVPLHGGVGLTRLPAGEGGEAPAALLGELLDLSTGGARVSCRAQLHAGERLLLDFGAGERRFEKLEAEVLRVEPAPGGACRAHLAFRKVPPAARNRLLSAVARLDLQRQAARKLGPEK